MLQYFFHNNYHYYVSELQYSVSHDCVHRMMEWTKLWPFTVSMSVVLHCLNSCRTS